MPGHCVQAARAIQALFRGYWSRVRDSLQVLPKTHSFMRMVPMGLVSGSKGRGLFVVAIRIVAPSVAATPA